MIHYVKNISINENIPGDLEEIVFAIFKTSELSF